MSARMSAKVPHLGFTAIDRPPIQNPDLASSEFRVFPKLNEHLRGHQFDTDEAWQAEVRS